MAEERERVRPLGSASVTRRAVRAAERQRAIHAAALRIFRRKGFHAASMQDIADAVGLYKGSLYYYIASKDQLLAGLFAGLAQEVLAELGRICAGPGTAAERLRAMVRAYVHGVLRNLDAVRVYLREEQALPQAQLSRVRAERRAMRELFERVLADGAREGDLAPGDTKIAALAILGMCTWIHRWYQPRSRLSAAELADDLAARALRMVAA